MTETTAATSSESRRGLDLVIYLASQVSELKAADSMLQPIRQITARLAPNEPIADNDQKTIGEVSERLKQYLLTSETLRSFTPQQLEQRISDFMHGAQRRVFFTVLKVTAVVTVVLIAAIMLVPAPIGMATRGLTSSSTFFMMVHLAAAWLFISALKTFAPELRQDYRLIATGVIILGLGQIVQPIVQVLKLESTPYNTLWSVLPLIPSYILISIGVQRFARLVGRTVRWLNLPVIIAALVIVTVLSFMVPHAQSSASAELMDIIISMQAVNVTIVTVLAILTYRIAGALTSLYARPVRWLFAFTIVSILIGLYMIPVNILTGGVIPQPLLIPLILGIIVNGFILLRAGYDFSRAS